MTFILLCLDCGDKFKAFANKHVTDAAIISSSKYNERNLKVSLLFLFHIDILETSNEVERKNVRVIFWRIKLSLPRQQTFSLPISLTPALQLTASRILVLIVFSSLSIIFQCIQMLKKCSTSIKINFLRYEQSSQCKTMRDSSVSYASAEAKVDAWRCILLWDIKQFNFHQIDCNV